MDKEFQKNLDTLLDDDKGFLYPNWIRSAKYFKKLSATGKNITPALDALEKVFFESHQLPVMQPAIDAILSQLLRKSDSKRIRSLMIAKEDAIWVIEALRDRAKKKINIHPAVDALIEFVHYSMFDAIKTICYYLDSKKAELSVKDVATRFLKFEKSRAYLVRFTGKAIESGFDVTEVLPLCMQLLDHPEHRSETISTFAWIAEHDVDLSGVESRLIQELSGSKEEERTSLAYYLSLHYLKTKRLQERNGLTTHQSRWIRKGALKAARVHLMKSKRAELRDEMALFLLDPDSEIRSLASSAVRDALKEKISVTPTAPVLQKIVQNASNEVLRTGICQYILDIADSDRPAIATLEQMVRRLQRDPEIEFLESVLRNREPVNPCSICSVLPRSGNWNREMSIPREFKKLEGAASLKHCTECGNYYSFSFEEDYEYIPSTQTFTLQRLHPAEVLATIGDTEKDSYRETMGALLKHEFECLMHPNRWVRSEASWKLAEFALSRGIVSELEMLASRSDPTIRLEVYKSIALQNHPEKTLEITSLEGLLLRGSKDAEPEIRKFSAEVISAWHLKEKKSERLTAITESNDREIVRGFLTSLFRFVSANNPCEFHPQLIRFIAIPDDGIRFLVQWIRQELVTRGETVPPITEPLLNQLSDPDPEICNKALKTLSDLPPESNASTVIDSTRNLLNKTETRYHATQVLKKYSSHGIPIETAVSQILSELNKNPDASELASLLTTAVNQGSTGADIVLCAAFVLNNSESKDSSTRLISTLWEKGADLNPIVPAIQEFLDRCRGGDSYTDSMIRVLILHFAKSRNLSAMIPLLKHKTTSHRVSTAYVMQKMMEDGFDFKPILPALVESLTDRSSTFTEITSRMVSKLK